MTIINANKFGFLFLNRAQIEKGEDGMYKRITFAVLMVSVIGCTVLKQNFGTAEETPELREARSECRSQAEKKSLGKFENRIKQEDYHRSVFDTCMEKKGYNKFGKKVK